MMGDKQSLNPLKGFVDLIGNEAWVFQKIDDICRSVCEKYGYEFMYSPIVERESLFVKSVGEGTDIVDKEIFRLQHDTDRLVLRPEQTSCIVRAFLNNNLKSAKFYSSGPMFRHEKPQKLRQRQFSQFSCECLGFSDFVSKCDVILIMVEIIENLTKIFEISLPYVLEINSIGTYEQREKYIEYLKESIILQINEYSSDVQKKIYTNPLRVLDSKVESDQVMLEKLKKISEFLPESTNAELKRIKNFLEKNNINYKHNKVLVRGLDYYNDLVLEMKLSDETKNTIIAGGQYDYLGPKIMSQVKILPAIGFSIGIDRLAGIILSNISNNSVLESNKVIALCNLDASEEYCLEILQKIRKFSACELVNNYSRLPENIKYVNKTGKFRKNILIVGEEEEKKREVAIKNTDTREQNIISIDNIKKEMLI